MKRKKSSSARKEVKAPANPRKGFEKVFEKIYRMVLRIPRGRVMTYGQIARLLEDRFSPRLVGWAMHATPNDGRDIPWHRVINSRGSISTGRLTVQQPDLQRLLLEAEGVVFNDSGHCDLSVFQWSPGLKRTRTKATISGKKLSTITGTKPPKRKSRNGNNS